MYGVAPLVARMVVGFRGPFPCKMPSILGEVLVLTPCLEPEEEGVSEGRREAIPPRTRLVARQARLQSSQRAL